MVAVPQTHSEFRQSTSRPHPRDPHPRLRHTWRGRAWQPLRAWRPGPLPLPSLRPLAFFQPPPGAAHQASSCHPVLPVQAADPVRSLAKRRAQISASVRFVQRRDDHREQRARRATGRLAKRPIRCLSGTCRRAQPLEDCRAVIAVAGRRIKTIEVRLPTPQTASQGQSETPASLKRLPHKGQGTRGGSGCVGLDIAPDIQIAHWRDFLQSRTSPPRSSCHNQFPPGLAQPPPHGT